MKFRYFNISLLCLVLPAWVLAQSETFVIKGKINPSHNGEMVLAVYPNGKTPIKDSVVVENGVFTFTGKMQAPGVGFLRLGKTQPANSVDVYLSKGEITVTANDSLKDAVIGGTKLAEDYVHLMLAVRPILKQRAVYSAEFAALPADQKKGPEAKAIALKIQGQTKEAVNAMYDFMDHNPDSYLSLDNLEKIAGSVIDYDVIMPKFEKLSENLKNSEKGKAFYDKIIASRSMQIGSIAKGFESLTPDGKKLTLHDVVLTGKYTLVDFWASWCGPCRAENPNVVNAYKTYHDKGFNILSVSLDTKAENWKAAIAKDGMPWNHVSSLLGWKEPAAQLYGVHAIPQNVLLDSKGVVVAKDLRGAALLEKLKQLMM